MRQSPTFTLSGPHGRRRLLRAMCLCALLGIVMPWRTGVTPIASGMPTAPQLGAALQPSLPQLALGWSSAEGVGVWATAWGDMDADGYLDLAVALDGQPNRIYRNEGGRLSAQPVWVSAETPNATMSLAWGDLDGDGYPELAAGNVYQPNRVYRNQGGSLETRASWSGTRAGGGADVAWGDVDGDGRLDLVSGFVIYRNTGSTLGAAQGQEGFAWKIALGDADGDLDLDLAVAGGGRPEIYLNHGGAWAAEPAWDTGEGTDYALDVAWGDVNRDGRLDLALASEWTGAVVYTNTGTFTRTGQLLGPVASWTGFEARYPTSVAWGDADHDGLLDLAVGDLQGPSHVYLNLGDALAKTSAWAAEGDYGTRHVAWADLEGDGDLDLSVANQRAQSAQVYLHRPVLRTERTELALDERQLPLFWADMDGDGDMDAAGGTPLRVYRNDGDAQAALTRPPLWAATETAETSLVTWGDVDGDLDLDLGVVAGRSVRVYRNNGGQAASAFDPEPIWSSGAKQYWGANIAWGDVDGDDDLDLVLGAIGHQLDDDYIGDAPVEVYRNEGGQLVLQQTWLTLAEDEYTDRVDVALGDMDGDGDLDLVLGTTERIRIYHNEHGRLPSKASWSMSVFLMDMTLGDVDSDGALDVVVANGWAPELYRNEGGLLAQQRAWSSLDGNESMSVDLGDMDNDGDLDLLVASHDYYATPTRIYSNEGGALTGQSIWSTNERMARAWEDVDGDGWLDLIGANPSVDQEHTTMLTVYHNLRPRDVRVRSLPAVTALHAGQVGQGHLYASAQVWGQGTVPFTYRLAHPGGQTIRKVLGQYSLDGGGTWLPAVPAAGTSTTNLATSPAGVPHAFTWDVYASQVMGHSDNARFRLLAFADPAPGPRTAAGPYVYAAYGSTSLPFRVRGNQIRVTAGGQPQANALVYRLPASQLGLAEPYLDPIGAPLRTNGAGYLQGTGQLQVGDQLVALLPITTTAHTTRYHTSAAPTRAGLDLAMVSAPGLQQLEVSAANPLLLFSLHISLEWDARRDAAFLRQLESDLRRASELLYDWSNGQLALGPTTVHHDKEHWDEADVRLYARNDLRPTADQGGLGTQVIADPLLPAIQYAPGQVHIGAIWNRSGRPDVVLGDDWPRVLAHELGHYLLYLDDNYLGYDERGMLISVDSCPGAMTDPYRADYYSEFHPDEGWLPACAATLSNQATGRSDWGTIASFYPWINVPQGPISAESLDGPGDLPLAVTQLRQSAPATPTEALPVTIFYLNAAGASEQPGPGARAVLYQDRQAPAGAPDRLIDLGRPGSTLNARGARAGDRLCIFDPARDRQACELIAEDDDQLTLVEVDQWQPDVSVTPVTSTTLRLVVRNIPAGLTLKARLYPGSLWAAPATLPVITLAEGAGLYVGSFAALAEPAFDGHLQVWVAEADTEQHPRRETVVDFAVGGNPGRIKAGVGRIKAGVGRIKAGVAPLHSADGRAFVAGAELGFDAGELFLLQPIGVVPAPPEWASPIGQAYRLTTSASLASLEQTVMNISYAPLEATGSVTPGLEIYYLDERQPGATWRVLPTTHNQRYPLTSAPAQGPGLYALMSSVPLQLKYKGWNTFTYPLQTARSISSALSSIAGRYSHVYRHDPDDQADPWRVFAPAAPPWVNDLQAFEFGRSYWIHIGDRLTVALPSDPQAVSSIVRVSQEAGEVQAPPATYYGLVLPDAGFVPAAGMPVEAYVDGQRCGRGLTRSAGDQVVYVVDVASEVELFGSNLGCGRAGRRVTFRVDGQPMTPVASWQGPGVRHQPLWQDAPFYHTYLPDVGG